MLKKLILMISEQHYKPYMLFMITVILYIPMPMMKRLQHQLKNLSSCYGNSIIINKELGLAKNENPIQGSFIIEELTDLVEEAVLIEFDRITERGGVLGAMETMYQRSKFRKKACIMKL